MSQRGFLKSSEAIAASYLESLGFKIVDVHRKVVINDVEISDVDIVAERDGVLYAVEVKAGGVDVDAIRQAYVNAKLVKAKPMVIGRGYSDPRAEVVARELGVDVILLPDLMVLSVNELRDVIRETLYSVLGELLSFIAYCGKLGEGDLEVLRAIAESETFTEACEKLGVSERELASRIASLRSKGVLPWSSYKGVTLAARILVACNSYIRAYPNINQGR